MGTNLQCKYDIKLPANTPTGQLYTLYQVWDQLTASSVDPDVPDGKQELYTTCMDVDIISADSIPDIASSKLIANKELNSTAIFSELAQQSNLTVFPASLVLLVAFDVNKNSPLIILFCLSYEC